MKSLLKEKMLLSVFVVNEFIVIQMMVTEVKSVWGKLSEDPHQANGGSLPNGDPGLSLIHSKEISKELSTDFSTKVNTANAYFSD